MGTQSLTYNELHAVTQALAPLVEGSIVQKVFEDTHQNFILRTRRPGRTLLLLISPHPDMGRVHLVEHKPKQPESPSSMTRAMRKWMGGMVIHTMGLQPDDRVLTLRGHAYDPEHEGEDTKPPKIDVALIVEWTGKATNVFMVRGEDDRIIYMLRQDAHARALRPGDPYTLPPAPPAAAGGVRWPEGLSPDEYSPWLEASFQDALESVGLATLKQETLGRIKRERKRLARLVRNIEGDLERAQRAQKFRVWGELLQGAYASYTKGASSMRVVDYYDPDLNEVEIELDPGMDLQRNIDAYFRAYKRLHGAIDDIETRLIETMDKQEKVDALAQVVRQAEDATALADQVQQWERERLLRRARAQSGKRGKQAPTKLPYRSLVSRRGTPILVGRGSKGNDHLSVRVARGRDVWFHARDWAGAHVILRVESNATPHDADVLDAAMLAAHFSKGNQDTVVDVTMAQAKHVRKPKGYPQGMVTVAGGSTIAVHIDHAILSKLLAHETP